MRARIVLACAEGRSNTAVTARLGVNRGTVVKWRARFLARRLDGQADRVAALIVAAAAAEAWHTAPKRQSPP